MMVTRILLQTSHGGTNSASKPGMVACTFLFVNTVASIACS